MRKTRVLLFGTFFALAVGAGALATVPGCNNGTLGGGGTGEDDLSLLESIRVEPAAVTLTASPSMAATQSFKAYGKFPGSSNEVEITSKVVWYTDQPTVGVFNDISSSTFTSSTGNGGLTKALAQLQATGLTGSGDVKVKFAATVNGPDGSSGGTGGMPLPADPGKSFPSGGAGGSADATRAPKLMYPNNGVMLPPNIQKLEVHFDPGAAKNTLFEVSFTSELADIKTYLRCVKKTPDNVTTAGCVYALDQTAYTYVAATNRGGAPVKLRVRGSDDTGTGFGESAEFDVSFAEQNVNGGLYYWTVSGDSAIMRVDFGGDTLKPQEFLSPGKNGFGTCVGCHAISRDGTKMVASLGGQNDGRLVYIANMAAYPASPLTVNGTSQTAQNNRIQFASFSPAGDRFVAIYGDQTVPERNKLRFHDGNTGLRLDAEAITLSFEPNHPDWAPNSNMIAMGRVPPEGHNTSQRSYRNGIELVTRTGTTWSAPQTIMPVEVGKSRYNPNFAPDSSFLIFSESVCPANSPNDGECDGDADNPAKTYAIKPAPGSQPIFLKNAGSPGLADGTNTNLADTFPRFSPFQNKQGSGRIFWVTVASRRKAGYRDPAGKQWLWMFAVDPDKVNAGQDGSYPAFYLPFQDLTTSNHIGQWTQKVVGAPG